MIGCHGKRKEFFEDNRIKVQLKSDFNLLYKVLANTFKATIYVLAFGMLIAYMYMPWYIYPLAIMLIAAAKMMLEEAQYENTEYNFYATKLEYKDGLYNKSRVLKYEDIREIIMTQNVFERLFGIGTIRILINFTDAINSNEMHEKHKNRIKFRFSNGIKIPCVSNVHEQHELIKRIINEGTE